MSDTNESKEYKLSRGYSYYLFTLLFLLYLFNYVDRVVVTSLFPFIQKDWGLTDTQCGMLVSVVYWSIVFFYHSRLHSGGPVESQKDHRIMALLWSIATAACASPGAFPS